MSEEQKKSNVIRVSDVIQFRARGTIIGNVTQIVSPGVFLVYSEDYDESFTVPMDDIDERIYPEDEEDER